MNKYGHAVFYLTYCFYGQKIDIEKTARTTVTQMNDDSYERSCKPYDDSNDEKMIKYQL